MPDIALRPPAELKPLASDLSEEVLDWVGALRRIWADQGLSMNQFASLHPIDKGSISRYLNGQRVPGGRWFLDTLLAIQADYGQPVTPAVREHLTGLQLRALEVAHPHEYRVRLVKDELQIAVTGKLEAERYAHALEEQLVERNRQVAELAEAKGRLRDAWDADRVAMQADYERLTEEIGKITGRLRLAQERTAQAERRCRLLDDLLDHLYARTPADNEDNTGTHSPVSTVQSLVENATYALLDEVDKDPGAGAETRSLAREILALSEEARLTVLGRASELSSMELLWRCVTRTLPSGGAVTVELDPASYAVQLSSTDYQLARRWLSDLIANACQAGAKWIDVGISVEEQLAPVRTQIVLQVDDDGPGMPVGVLDNPTTSLAVMAEHLRGYAGTLAFSLRTGGGTRACVRWQSGGGDGPRGTTER